EQEGFDFEDPGAAGLVMVSETRTVEIPAGLSTLVFRGVADQIVPQTAALEGLPAVILESNFDYDLLTPGAVIAKSRGEHVQLVRTDTATGRTTVRDAILRTGPSGVVLDVDGTAEALDCSGLTEKLVFPRMPPGLADEPRLSMTVRAATAGKYTVQLSYLALGIDWSADYVARIDPDDRRLTLTGWLTLVNRAGTTFANTPAEVVAGDLARDEEETRPPGPTKVQEHPQCWPIGSFTAWPEIADRMFRKAVADDVAAAAPGMMANRELQEVIVTAQLRTKAQMRELGDYKLYAVPEPTTLAARQSKQVQFLSEHSVPFTRIYQFTADQDTMMEDAGEDVAPQRANVLLRLQNKESDGLGKPLPAGVVSVMESAGSGSLLAGQDKIDDTPVGLPVDLTLGTAMDVWIEPRVIAGRTIEHEDYDEHRLTIEVRLGNDKPVPITLEYRQPQQGENFRIVRESRPHTLKDGDMQWTFRLRPGERVTFRYSMQANE
ncbi:MAG TPA: hypothetical protein VJS12_02400, partial [Steroidobacteraceae bacterium]|nr:hypothetical protein [Steroidobacteraceae bacterium]